MKFAYTSQMHVAFKARDGGILWSSIKGWQLEYDQVRRILGNFDMDHMLFIMGHVMF